MSTAGLSAAREVPPRAARGPRAAHAGAGPNGRTRAHGREQATRPPTVRPRRRNPNIAIGGARRAEVGTRVQAPSSNPQSSDDTTQISNHITSLISAGKRWRSAAPPQATITHIDRGGDRNRTYLAPTQLHAANEATHLLTFSSNCVIAPIAPALWLRAP